MRAQIIQFRDYQKQNSFPQMQANIETSLARINHMTAEVTNVFMIDTVRAQKAEAAATEGTARRNIRSNVYNDGVHVAIISNDMIAFNGDADGVYATIIRNDIITFGNGR